MTEHYFAPRADLPHNRRTLDLRLAGRDVQVTTDSGVFSGDRLDLGTSVLLRSVPEPPDTGNLLDLGCGWGPIALSLATQAPAATVWAVDVNERARDLTAENAANLGITNIRVSAPEDVPADLCFAALWSNPPIRIGKEALHELLVQWLPRLEPSGLAHLVVAKNLGADSLMTWINAHIPTLEAHKLASAKGFRVLEIGKRP